MISTTALFIVVYSGRSSGNNSGTGSGNASTQQFRISSLMLLMMQIVVFVSIEVLLTCD